MPLRLSRYIPRKFYTGALYVFFVVGLLFYYLSLPSKRSLFSSEHVLPAKPLVLHNGVHPFEAYKSLVKKDWHDYAAMKADEDEIYRQNGYDGYASDQIALNRSIKDIRHKECRSQQYIEKLPTVSLIFPFHDEHNSTLLRSVYSVINRSPPGVVREVILVDDASTKPALREPLTDSWRRVGLDHIVKVVRTQTIVCPFVDVIDCDTFELRPQDEDARGSFDWHFNYKRLPLTKEDEKHPTRPFDSPVMAGATRRSNLRTARVRTPQSGGERNGGDRFELRKCISDDPGGGGEQNLRMSFWYDVRPKGRNLCFDVSTSTDHSPVVLFGCHGMKGNQHFKYKMATKQMHHPVSNLCMDCDVERGEIFMSRCDSSATTQKWTWEHLNETVMEERNKVQP
ncbi:Polypeptide N-acetylgalactosaminyltransferase [Aphelenchoides fujianensis]|nr:Polypeptide N-acetylgalactosaminyltransferase [Aphelenchoides fujianensis]